MTAATPHAVAAEDIMALLDGELSAGEAQTVLAHLDACVECAAVAVQFRETSRELGAWMAGPAPETLDAAVHAESVKMASRRATMIPPRSLPGARKGRAWVLAAGFAITAVVVLRVFSSTFRYSHTGPRQGSGVALPATDARRLDYSTAARSTGANSALGVAGGPAGQETNSLELAGRNFGALSNLSATGAAPNPAAPMIARTVALLVLVKDVGAARAALDSILGRYQGYAAQLNISTPEGSARSFNSSLRVPAPQLAAALAELRALGRVQNESQSGEEVTEQHADLAARLRNARETEQRLLAILQQRTGKVEEVLQVEEQISATRGEIERMEAVQKELEHRVSFATVQLVLAEEYKAQLGAPSTSVGTRMRNAFVAGIESAGSTVLGMVLFGEEYGPVLLVWLVVLAAPLWFFWRRYRKAQAGL